jgi:hypothetical protein
MEGRYTVPANPEGHPEVTLRSLHPLLIPFNPLQSPPIPLRARPVASLRHPDATGLSPHGRDKIRVWPPPSPSLPDQLYLVTVLPRPAPSCPSCPVLPPRELSLWMGYVCLHHRLPSQLPAASSQFPISRSFIPLFSSPVPVSNTSNTSRTPRHLSNIELQDRPVSKRHLGAAHRITIWLDQQSFALDTPAGWHAYDEKGVYRDRVALRDPITTCNDAVDSPRHLRTGCPSGSSTHTRLPTR